MLIMGPPGAGKTTVIQHLRALDSRFVYIAPYMTRGLRPGETDKVSIAAADLDRMQMKGEFVVVNELYGVKYGTPRRPIIDALHDGRFPVIDWPISRVSTMMAEFPGRVVRIYLRPPTTDILCERLSSRQTQVRDLSVRMTAARLELAKLDRGDFNSLIDAFIVTTTGDEAGAATLVRDQYLQGCTLDQTQRMRPE